MLKRGYRYLFVHDSRQSSGVLGGPRHGERNWRLLEPGPRDLAQRILSGEVLFEGLNSNCDLGLWMTDVARLCSIIDRGDSAPDKCGTQSPKLGPYVVALGKLGTANHCEQPRKCNPGIVAFPRLRL
jgi:hypothetical protein